MSSDWLTYDLDEYVSTYWIDEINNELIELVGSNTSKYMMNNFELHHFDLTSHHLIKKTNTNTYFIPPTMKFNSKNSLFYFVFLDTAYFFDKSNFLFNRKLKLPFEFGHITNFTYDDINNNYKVFSFNPARLVIATINASDNELVEYDTLGLQDYITPSIIIADNASLFAIKCNNKEINIYSSEDMSLIRTLHSDLDINKISISGYGEWVSVFSNFIADENYKFYNLQDSTKDFSITNNYYGFPKDIKFTKNSEHFLISYYYHSFIYNSNDRQIIREIESPNTVNMIDFCPDGKEIVTISSKKIVLSSEILDNKFYLISDFDRFGKITNISKLRLDRYKNDFYVSGAEGTISRRKQSSGRIDDEYSMPSSTNYILNHSVGDTLIVFSYRYNCIFYIDVNTKETIDSISFANYTRFAGRISKDDSWFASLTNYNKLLLANLDEYKSENKFYTINTAEIITFFAYSDDTRYFAVGVSGNKIKIYDLRTLDDDIKPLYILKYPSEKPIGNINYIKFIDNGKRLISSSSTVKDFYVWDLDFEEIELMPQSNPFDTTNHINHIKFFEYRSKYNDYISIDNRDNIYFWTKNFELITKKNLSRILRYDIASSIDYEQTNDELFVACSNSTIAKFNFGEVITSVSNIDFEQSMLNISPNPASDFIEINSSRDIDLSNANLYIYNIMGFIQPFELLSNTNEKIRINISNLPIGVYYIKLDNQTAKFIKQ